jgi:tetratricopeptide (TPR) repeat protein
MDIEGMRERYRALGDDERKLLLSIRYLYELDVYRGKDLFPLPWVLTAAKHKYKYEPDEYARSQHLKALSAGGFIINEEDTIRVEEAYLDLVIDKIGIHLDDFHGMTTALATDPEALHLLGNKAIGIGERVTDKAHLMKAAIAALQSALTKWTKTKDRYSYGAARNSLGMAYGRLSEVERPKENIVESIKSFKEAKKVFTHREFPMDYAMTQNNLGVSYQGLAKLDDPAGNLKRAVDAYREALRVRTPESLPIDYALTMENLGLAYATLAEHEEREKNFSLAEKAVEAALVIFRQQKMTRNIEKAERNLNKIKAAHGEAPPKKSR